MRVLCTGPESSGTRLLTRLTANLGVDAVHKSVPHSTKWWDETDSVDRIIVIVRDPFVTEISAVAAKHPTFWSGTEATFPYRVTNAWEVIIDNVRRLSVLWIPLTYEGLLDHPQFTMDRVAAWLGVDSTPIAEPIANPRPEIKD